jgi:putative ABC transport system substrate-binding protein
MEKPIVRIAILTFLAVAFAVLLSACQRDVIIVGILEPDLGELVVDARTGFLEALDDADFSAGENMRFLRRSAEFREEPLDQLAVEFFDDEEVDYLLALGTPALEAALKATGRKQVFFAMSGDSTIGGAADGEWSHQAIVAGAAAPVPAAELVATLRRLLPEVRVVGLLFNQLDPDSQAGVGLISTEATRAGLRVIVTGVTGRDQIAQATAQAIEDGAGALLLSPSRLLDAEFSDIRYTADERGVAVIGWSERLAKGGALASVGVDYEDHGRRVGLLAVRVLRGEGVGPEPVSTGVVTHLWLNRRTGERLGVPLPADLVDRAAEIFS